MKNNKKPDIKSLFTRLCCSRCKNEFDENSVKILRKENDILICNLHCEKCGKDFGEIILNYAKKNGPHSPLEIVEGPPPIDYDDVIEAHRFIRSELP